MESVPPPEALTGFIDDARPFLPGQPSPDSPLLGVRVLAAHELPPARGHARPVRAVLDGGAGDLAGVVGLAERLGLDLVAVEIALRDGDDPAGNARRVVAAYDALPDGVRPVVLVRMQPEPTPGWLAAADELAAAELGLIVPLDGDVRAWADAALDRELPFALRGGDLATALEALRTTAGLWGDADDLVAARRWCRSWSCPDPAAAVGALGAA